MAVEGIRDPMLRECFKIEMKWTEPLHKPGDPPWWMTEFAARVWRMGYEAAKADFQNEPEST